jgi:4-amino-4-deoxy-L-arabinose transferase-like glycosyltransferase
LPESAPAAASAASPARAQRAGWRIGVLLLLLWGVGIATRSVWTPDEPREYGLSWSMQQQTVKSVPLLGGEPFLEKPPLTYWAAATAMAVAGSNPLAARLPNLLYGALTVLCTAWLAASMAPAARRRPAAALAALVIGTAWLDFQHTVWLATDAPLLAFSALCWLGLWLALHGGTPRTTRWGLLTLHLGLGLAFMSKNLLGLIAPLLALGILIVLERRWALLAHPALWAGACISLGMIGGWVASLLQQPNGSELLRIALWDNSIGRFLPVATAASYNTGHLNSFGKIPLEVSLGMLPWLFLIVTGLWQCLQSAYRRGAAPAARFILAAALPLLLLLCLSSTVRDVYALPATVPLALAAGLAVPGAWTLRLTRCALWCIGMAGCALAVLVPWLADGSLPSAALPWLLALIGVALLLWAGHPLTHALPATRGITLYVCGLWLALLSASPIIERGQDLRATAQQAAAQAGARAILLTRRDETMRAALVYAASRNSTMVSDFAAAARSDITAAALVEVDADRLTAAMRGRLSRLVPALAKPFTPEAGVAAELLASGWSELADYQPAGGRHYKLLIRTP